MGFKELLPNNIFCRINFLPGPTIAPQKGSENIPVILLLLAIALVYTSFLFNWNP